MSNEFDELQSTEAPQRKEVTIHEPFIDDNTYYADTDYISNSNLGRMRENIHLFAQYLEGKYQYEKQQPFTVGRFFHTLLLEPQKASNFHRANVKGRNTKAFQGQLSEVGFDWLLTSSEWDMCIEMEQSFKRREKLMDILTEGIKETPAIGVYRGVPIKGKADIIVERDGKRIGYDPKSTSKSVSDFGRSARFYNYDRQAALYMELFGLDEFYFIPVEKSYPYTPALIKASDEFIRGGYHKLNRDIDFYKHLFIDGNYDPDYLLEESI